MATLVLSTVGTALGGPIGGAIGSLIGQSIDQQLFGPGPRSGPRLGDLAVQTSSYGTAIPRIYGRMRVAGTVVWATDLKESSETQSGAKGQPDIVTYSYSVSLAVALSSRKAQRIKRIWADGKLLRGEGGDFKVKTAFRFHPGGEDQAVDPLIASIEGIADTPAYRGLALAVFEDLQLADYGNRIPFLTFELEADDGTISLSEVLADASEGTVQSSAGQPVGGYAAYGQSIRSAIDPLVEHFGLELFDDGHVVGEAAVAQTLVVADEELGCAPSLESAPPKETRQEPARTLPSALTLSYYDPARDYQAGQARASTGDAGGVRESVELPIAAEAGDAKALAEASLARRWAQRDRMRLRLPPELLTLEPGARIRLLESGNPWVVETVTIEAMVAVADLRPSWLSVDSLPAEPGRAVPAPDIVTAATEMTLLDLPDLGTGRHDVPVLHLAAANSSSGWRAVPIEIATAGEIQSSQSAFGEAVMGNCLSALGPGGAGLFDDVSDLEVELVDAGHWLESRDDVALVGGENLAAVGSELVQFGSAIPIGPKRFRLTHLLRGRRGTEWAIDAHAAGERFVLLGARSLRAIELAREQLGSSVGVRALGIGDAAGTENSAIAGGEAMRPPSPVHLSAQMNGGRLQLSWVRRSRNGWAWQDEMDAPLGEAAERYRVRVESSSGALEAESVVANFAFEAEQLAGLGSGAAVARVAQIGDFAISRPALLDISLA